jgi:UDPglucose--hexose-1-phosphate uridylyltransferase
VHKTTIRLADGRELSYYDAVAGEARDAVDRRNLPPANAASPLRYEPFLDTWILYSSHRQDRSYLPSAQDCPLCPTKEGHPTEIPAADYEVAVFENRFPALSASPPDAAATPASCWRSGRRRAGPRSSSTPPTTTRRSRTCPGNGSSWCWTR